MFFIDRMRNIGANQAANGNNHLGDKRMKHNKVRGIKNAFALVFMTLIFTKETVTTTVKSTERAKSNSFGRKSNVIFLKAFCTQMEFVRSFF